MKKDHVLKLELKQVVKKLKEDPRIEMMWEEQDQADQRKSVNKQDNLSFKIKKQETKPLQFSGMLPWTNLFNQEKR